MSFPLSTHFTAYIDFCMYTKGLRGPTVKSYQDVFRHFNRLMPEVTHAEQLTPAIVDQFFVRLQQRERKIGKGRVAVGIKASTIRTYGSKLHTFFDWLCARGHLVSNPVNKSQLPKPSYSDKRALEKREIERIIAAITQYVPDRFQLKRDLAIVHVLLFAGLRKTELLSLNVSDVDFVRRILTVRGSTSKSKTTRNVPLTPLTTMHLEDYMRERQARRCRCERLWVSTKADTAFTSHGLKHWVYTLRRRSGVSFHVHRFRHTFACMLGRNNVSAVKIQKLMGHTDLRMTQTYMRSLGVEDVRDSLHYMTLDNLADL